MELLLAEQFPPGRRKSEIAREEAILKVKMFSDMWDNADEKAEKFAGMFGLKKKEVMNMTENDFKIAMKDWKEKGEDWIKATEKPATYSPATPDANGNYIEVEHPILRKQKIQKLAELWGMPVEQLMATSDESIIARKKEDVVHANDLKKNITHSETAKSNAESKLSKDELLRLHRAEIKAQMRAGEIKESESVAVKPTTTEIPVSTVDQYEVEKQEAYADLKERGYFDNEEEFNIYVKKHGHIPSAEEMERVAVKVRRYEALMAKRQEALQAHDNAKKVDDGW